MRHERAPDFIISHTERTRKSRTDRDMSRERKINKTQTGLLATKCQGQLNHGGHHI